MEKIDQIYDIIEKPIYDLGLMDSKWKRFGFFTVCTFGIFYVIKPSAFFDKKGKLKQWAIISNPYDKNVTYMPLYIFSPFVGLLSILFI